MELFEELIHKYLKKLRSIAEHSDISDELSFRPAFDFLLAGLTESLEKKKLGIITEPLKKAFGRPDYKIKSGKDFLIGYIETKGITSDIESISKSGQIKRYLGAGQRLILTNYLEFILFDTVRGEKDSPIIRVEDVTLLSRSQFESNKKPKNSDIEALYNLFDRFLREARPDVDGARGLAKRMANIAHIIRDSIGNEFETNTASNTLQDLHKAFQEILIPDLKTHITGKEKGKGVVTSFDDMYAQTIVYGLFAARCNHDKKRGPFTRRLAAYDLPKTNPFLKKLFEQIAGPDLEEEPFCWAVDDLAHLLEAVDMEAVLKDFGKRTQREDPVVHFYETFLKEYDPKLKEARGVYYTPEAVVSYIVSSVDYLLKTKLNRPTGLTDENTLILDPACGTGTFLYEVIDHIRNQFKDNAGKWPGYVENHILPRIFGFELLMAPYAVAHMKLGLQLAAADMPEEIREDWKYDFSSSKRLEIFLTNTLEETFHKSEKLVASWIADEALSATRVKRDEPIMVVLGNPPYSGHSANRSEKIEPIFQEEKWVGKGAKQKRILVKYDPPKLKRMKTWIGNLIQDYYMVDGKPLNERNPKWLQDDYVKFIRFGQWRIERTGKGILAFITNHGYLDNPTFRGMRQHLIKSFSEIYILNLHGNAKKREKCPDGSKDENVFDIQQGVSIGIFIKEKEKSGPAEVYYTDIWGIRESKDKSFGKYPYLFSHSLEDTEWLKIEPEKPQYFFVPQNITLKEEYEKGWKVVEIIKLHGAGMTTARDHMVIDFEQLPLLNRVTDFRDSHLSDTELCKKFNISEKKGWNISKARRLIKGEKDLGRFIVPVQYRPFDTRLIFYHDSLVWRTVKQVMGHMLAGPNIGLLWTRPMAPNYEFSVFITKAIADQCVIGNKLAGAGISYLGPLFLYPVQSIATIQERLPHLLKKEINLNPAFVTAVETSLGLSFNPECRGDLNKTFGPEDILNYLYAIFHSPTYRNRYIDFLKRDFPHIPLTKNKDLFRIMIEKGRKLVSLHLLEAPCLENMFLQPNYPVKGDDIIKELKYKGPGEKVLGQSVPITKGRVYINKTQFFDGIEPEVWNFHIGGYQVCQKWLKDRKGRKLTHEEITHYQKIVVALRETILIMKEIDEAIPEWPIK